MYLTFGKIFQLARKTLLLFLVKENFFLKLNPVSQIVLTTALVCAYFFVVTMCVSYFFPYSRYNLYNYPSLA